MVPGPGCPRSSRSFSISPTWEIVGKAWSTLCFSLLICKMGRKSTNVFVSWPGSWSLRLGEVHWRAPHAARGMERARDGIQQAWCESCLWVALDQSLSLSGLVSSRGA